jgi:hypothetical protein
MDVVHRRSAEQGHLAQAITGIPTFYRRFGYEMALELAGGRTAYRAGVPELPSGDAEPVSIRPAIDDDVPFMTALDERARSRGLVTAVRDERLRHYEMNAPREERYRPALRIIEAADGAPVGYLAHANELWGNTLAVFGYELVPGTSWLSVTPAALRYLRTAGDAYAKDTGTEPLAAIGFQLGTDHPVYRAIPDRLPRVIPPYSWYLRVPGLPAFLRHVAPVLEQRIAASVAAGHSAELRLGSYEGGVRLVLADGRITSVEACEAAHPDGVSAWFPGLTFLHVLFGHRALAEIEAAFPDCRVNTEEARVLLDVLFPKAPSRVWHVW